MIFFYKKIFIKKNHFINYINYINYKLHAKFNRKYNIFLNFIYILRVNLPWSRFAPFSQDQKDEALALQEQVKF